MSHEVTTCNLLIQITLSPVCTRLYVSKTLIFKSLVTLSCHRKLCFASMSSRDSSQTSRVKTSHAGWHDKFLEENMHDWLAGSHLALESTIDGVDLLAIAFEKKVACFFVATKGAGHTEAGVPHETKWKDENGNTRSPGRVCT